MVIYFAYYFVKERLFISLEEKRMMVDIRTRMFRADRIDNQGGVANRNLSFR